MWIAGCAGLFLKWATSKDAFFFFLPSHAQIRNDFQLSVASNVYLTLDEIC